MKEIKAIVKVIKSNKKGIFIIKRNEGMGTLDSISKADPKSLIIDSSKVTSDVDIYRIFHIAKKYKVVTFDRFNDLNPTLKKLAKSKLDELEGKTVILIG